MRPGAIRRLGVAVALTAVSASLAWAHDPVAWQQEREGLFAKFKASHPPQDAAIASVKQQTAAMLANYTLPSGPALDRPPVIWRPSGEPVVVFDAAVGPRMVVVPAGEFTMGSAVGEPGRGASELPRRRVRIARAFAVSMFPVTYGEYADFVFESGRAPGAGCVLLDHGSFVLRRGSDWADPGFEQTFRSPATCIGFDDATAYAAWLSAKTGQR